MPPGSRGIYGPASKKHPGKSELPGCAEQAAARLQMHTVSL